MPGALTMYRDAVVRLRSVMERVGMDLGPLPHGLGLPEQTEQDREEIAQARRRRKSTNGRSEEEGKTLKGIVGGHRPSSWVVIDHFHGCALSTTHT